MLRACFFAPHTVTYRPTFHSLEIEPWRTIWSEARSSQWPWQ